MISDYAAELIDEEFKAMEEQYQLEEKYHLKELEVPITYYDARKKE